ncbi:MAG: DUF262 domain-containing protein, partial [Oscillospiraceae bacterium]|nr:DUF262 domain-containing protein [Oscillospiraceae bacterium]
MEIFNSKIKSELENIVILAKECCDGAISESLFRDVFQSLKGDTDTINAAKEYLMDQDVQIISDSSLIESMDDSPDTTSNYTIKPYDPSKIDISPKNMALVNLIGRIENDEVDMMPDFQRRAGLWSPIQKSQLIESLILRIPLPAFYFDGTDNDRWITIDGLQRLTALKEFFVDKTLHLTGLEFLRDLNGAYYENIPKVYIRRMQETQVVCYIINPGAPVNLKYNIFKRINTGGLELEPQEIRHALYQGFATKYLKELAETQIFLKATGYSVPTDRMLDREFVLRFIAFYEFDLQTYNGTIDDFLNRTMDYINSIYMSHPDYAIQIKDKFLTVLDACYSIFGKFSFRRMPDKNKRRSISKALFETWTSLLAHLDLEQIRILIGKSDEIQKKYMPMFTEDEDFYRSIGSGKVAAVRKRFEKIDSLIKAV